MVSESPASILYDKLGNPIGSIQDGYNYRLQVEAQIASPISLPLGASTEATLALIKAKTDNLDVALSTRAVTGLTDTQLRATPISTIVSYKDDGHLDAFSRLRVSAPQVLFDSKQLSDSQPLFWDDQQTSGASTTSVFVTGQSATQMAVSNITAGTRVRQTFQRFNYQPGKSLLVVLTGLFGAATSGITRRIGYFDVNNGLFFQLSGTTLGVVVRSFTSGAAVDTVITQNNWNLDKLDGYGTSGVTIDVTKTQIFVIDFQWLGVGRVRFGVNIGGNVIYIHQVLNANNLTTVYMSVPNLPLRYEISNNGTGPAATLYHICACVISEGGDEDTGVSISTDTGVVGFTTLNNTNIFPLVAIRLKSSNITAKIDLLDLDVINTSGDSFRYCLLFNPTIVGTALSFTDITNSAIQVSLPTNATTVTGGIQLTSGYIASSASNRPSASVSVQTVLRLGASIAGVSDIIVLGVSRISGTTSTFYGQMGWIERN